MYVINNELYHHGVLGMKWGVRRYQSYAENPKLSDRKKKKYAKKVSKKLTKLYRKGYDPSRPLLVSEEFKKEASDLLSAIDNNEKVKNLKIKEAEAAVKELESSFEESKIYDEYIRDAYEETIKEMQKLDPEYLESIQKDASKRGIDDLSMYNRFDTLYDGVKDELYSKYENRFNKEHPESKIFEKKWEEAFSEVQDAKMDVVKEIFGEYGDKKLKGGYSLNELLTK